MEGYNKLMAELGRLEQTARQTANRAPYIVKNYSNQMANQMANAIQRAPKTIVVKGGQAAKLAGQTAKKAAVKAGANPKAVDELFQNTKGITQTLKNAGVAEQAAAKGNKLVKVLKGGGELSALYGIPSGAYHMFAQDQPLRNRVLGGVQAVGGGISLIPHPVARGAGMVMTTLPALWYKKTEGQQQPVVQQPIQEQPQQEGLEQIPVEQLVDIDSAINKAYNVSAIPTQAQPPEGQLEQFIRNNQSTNNYQDVPQELPSLPDIEQQPTQQPQRVDDGSDLARILELAKLQTNQNAPYIEALTNYLNNYDKLMGQGRRQQAYWSAASGFSKNPAYKDLAKSYSPDVVEANRVRLLQELSNAKAGNAQALINALGNAKLAKQFGLPAEAALSNKDMLDAMVKLQIARTGLEGKQYAADRTLEGRTYSADQGLYGRQYSADKQLQAAMYVATLNNQIRSAIAQGNQNLARQLANQRNQVLIYNAMLSNAPFGIDDVMSMNQALGNPAGIQGNVQQVQTVGNQPVSAGDYSQMFKGQTKRK